VRARSTIDELQDLIPLIIDELVKQHKKSKNMRVKTAVMHTLA
jgi:hypothetical protein